MNRDVNLGRVTFSIDFEPSLDLPEESAEEFDAVCRRLNQLFEQHKVAATWALADPARSVVREELRRSPLSHEIAVLGERSWLSEQEGRSRQVRELTRRLYGARNAGLAVSTLVLRDEHLVDSAWLRDLGIRCLRQRPIDDLAEVAADVAWRVPTMAGWFDRWLVRRRLSRTLNTAAALHVAVEASGYVGAGGSTGLQLLDQVLTLTTAAARKGRIAIVTLGKFADLAEAPVFGPSRSALRAAA